MVNLEHNLPHKFIKTQSCATGFERMTLCLRGNRINLSITTSGVKTVSLRDWLIKRKPSLVLVNNNKSIFWNLCFGHLRSSSINLTTPYTWVISERNLYTPAKKFNGVSEISNPHWARLRTVVQAMYLEKSVREIKPRMCEPAKSLYSSEKWPKEKDSKVGIQPPECMAKSVSISRGVCWAPKTP